MRTIISFDWTPKNAAVSFTIGGSVYDTGSMHQIDNVTRASDSRYVTYSTPSNTLLTFTASAILPSGVTIGEYRWDFGDGSIGFGSTVSHTYLIASPQVAAKLTVLDSLGQLTSTAKVLNLRTANRILVAGNVVSLH